MSVMYSFLFEMGTTPLGRKEGDPGKSRTRLMTYSKKQ